MNIDTPYQVIVSDITAFLAKNIYRELTLYMDLRDNEIVGYGLSSRRGDPNTYYEGLTKAEKNKRNILFLNPSKNNIIIIAPNPYIGQNGPIKNPVLIEGHTDSMPIQNERYPSNWELSTARATNIIKYLTQAHGLPPGRLSAVGYGEYMPVEKNTTPQGRAKNRRVDIIVLSSDKK